MPFKPSKIAYLTLALFAGFFIAIGIVYSQLSDTQIYYWYTQWNRYIKKYDQKSFSHYAIPLVKKDYRIAPGENFWAVAKRFDLNIDTLVSFNEVPKVHVIPANYGLQIPMIDGVLIKRNGNINLDEVSQRYRIDKRKILFFNPDFYSLSNVFLPGAYFNLEERMGKLGAEFLKPLKNIYITSLYGLRIHPITKKRQFHYGVDIRGAYGELVYSAKGGRVIYAGFASGFGNMVVVAHNKGYVSKYAHLSKIAIKNGVRIAAQQVIGQVGNTGISTGPHLHFEVWKNGKPIDPRDVTDFY